MNAWKSLSLPLILLAGTWHLDGSATLETQAAAEDAGDEQAEAAVVTADKAASDPFLGDWEGQWAKGRRRDLAAQVIPRGSGTYQINVLPALDQRCPAYAVVEAKAEGGILQFDQQGWSGRIEGDRFTGTGFMQNQRTAFEMKKVRRLSPRLGATPPEGAVVLFDGSGFEHWESDRRGGVEDIRWKLVDDAMRVWPPLKRHAFSTAIRTRQAFPDFHLHLEFRLPLIAEASGQTRANSGVIIEEFEFYEVQILDSYGLPGYWDDCGAIYNKEAPKVNMCAPPGQWQSYDVVYRSPGFDESGNLTAKARITVDHNGKLIHKEVELPYSERAVEARRQRPESRKPGRITLQHHGDPVEFRNVWLKKLEADAPNDPLRADPRGR